MQRNRKLNSGIYQITNLINGNKYIGKSKNLEKRIQSHKNNLEKIKHENSHLQRAYNKYGKKNFKFTIIVRCPLIYLTKLEQWFLDNYIDWDKDYNMVTESKGGQVYLFTIKEFYTVLDLVKNGITPEDIIKKFNKGKIKTLYNIFSVGEYRGIKIPKYIKQQFKKNKTIKIANKKSTFKLVSQVDFLLKKEFRNEDICKILNIKYTFLRSIMRSDYYEKEIRKLTLKERLEIYKLIKPHLSIKAYNKNNTYLFLNKKFASKFLLRKFPNKNIKTMYDSITHVLLGRQKTAYGYKWKLIKP